MEQRYNTRSPAVKRLMREAQELSEPTDQYYAQPLEDNLFEWHFTVRGPADTDFQGGIYHGRIILPVDYPMKPPSIIWLTPNGRFETNKKICLSISGHHPESWQPSWSIRTALLAIIGFMPTHPGGAIGSLDYKPEERKVLAKRSRDWKCPACGDITQILLEVPSEPSQADTKASQEAKELASQIAFQGEKPSCKETECPIEKAAATTSASSTSSAATDNQGVSNNSSVNAATSGPQSFPQANMSPQLPGFPPPCSGIARPVPDPGTFYHPFTQPFLPNPCWMPNMPTNYQSESGVAAMIPRFPYPPSHYPGGYSVPFYPTGLAPPPGVGMFPSPFLPPISPQGSPASGCQAMPLMTQNMPTPISVNNSSATYQSDGQTLAPNSASPSMSPIPHNPPTSPASSGVAENSMPNTPAPSPVRSSVLSELLAKVKRIGSDDNVEQGSSVDQASPATVNLSAAAQSTHVINKDVPTTELSSYSSEESAQSTTEAQATSASVQNKRSLDKSPYVVPEARKTTSVGPVKSSSIEEMAAASQVEKITGADKQEDSFTRGELQAGRVSQVSEEKGELHLLSTVSERRESERSSVSEQKKDVNIQEVVAQENVQVFLTSQIVTSVSNIPKETDVGDSSLVEEFAHTRPDSMPGVTDSEVSLSLKKQESPNDITGTEASHSELPADGEENSEAAAPPIEMSEGDEKSSIEKTASSSMSDLEKMRKLGNTKPLRQRQSATARIPQDVNEEEISDASPPVSRQRIEAASGDTTLRNPRLLRQGVRALNEARQIHREALAQVRQRQSPYYDISFLLMVGLCLATVFILLNRVFNTFDWTNISFSEFYQ